MTRSPSPSGRITSSFFSSPALTSYYPKMNSIWHHYIRVPEGTRVSDQFLQISPPPCFEIQINKGGAYFKNVQNLKFFPRLRRGFEVYSYVLHVFRIENRCFPVVSLIFFAPAAPETLSTHSISFRSNKHKSNTTVQNSGSSPAGVENHLNVDIQLIRRRRRENFGFLASKTQFSYWKTPFLQRSETFLESKSLKNGENFRPLADFPNKPPPLFWNPRKQGGGLFGRGGLIWWNWSDLFSL